MNTKFALCVGTAIGVMAGIAIGVVGVEAQTKPKAYMISESEAPNAQDFPKYLTEVRKMIKEAGGVSYLTANGKVTVIEGQAPAPHIGLTEWPTAEAAVNFYKGKDFQNAMNRYGIKVVRRFVVEAEQ